jgi:hypothetical protein
VPKTTISDGDRREVRALVLSVLAAGGSDVDAISGLAPVHVRGFLFPGDVVIELAADVLALSTASREAPLEAATLYERFLPERRFSGKTERSKSSYALRAVAMIHAGVEPDLAGDAGWYQLDDFWIYATYALITYVRAAADRTGRSVRCGALAASCRARARAASTSCRPPCGRER